MAVEPNRWGIIYNPKAGSRKTQKRWNEIRSYMENRKVVFDYVQSEGFGSVERLARTLAIMVSNHCDCRWRRSDQ